MGRLFNAWSTELYGSSAWSRSLAETAHQAEAREDVCGWLLLHEGSGRTVSCVMHYSLNPVVVGQLHHLPNGIPSRTFNIDDLLNSFQWFLLLHAGLTQRRPFVGNFLFTPIVGERLLCCLIPLRRLVLKGLFA